MGCRGGAAFAHLRKVCGKHGKLLTFGRWNRHDVSANRATICSRGGGASAHLRKVCGKRGKLLTFGRWNRHDVSANVATIGSRGVRKVSRKCRETAHLRKVGREKDMGKIKPAERTQVPPVRSSQFKYRRSLGLNAVPRVTLKSIDSK